MLHSRSNSATVVAVGVGQDLHLDVAGVASRSARGRRRRRRRPRASRRAPRTASASSPGRRTTRMPRPPPPAEALTSSGHPSASTLGVVGQRVAVDGDGRQGGHAGRPHHLLGADLRTHGVDGRGRRPDPDQAGAGRPPGRSRPTRTGSRSRGGRRRRRCAAAASRSRSSAGRCRPGTRPGSRTARSASATWGLSASASEYTATVAMPMARAVRDDPPGDLAAVGDQQVRMGRGSAATPGAGSRGHHIRNTP